MDKVLVSVRRVTKVVKGGRTMRFSAMVVVGDKKGKVGIGIGKASEVPPAIDKATAIAKKHMQLVNGVNGTISHQVIGKFGTSEILMIPAKTGTGLIAGGSARAVLELAGLTDVVTKVHGSTNKINVVKATFDGLSKIKTKEQIAEKRNKAVEEI
ncbi:MAG: 30S ribosomal protein S5 [Clostridia bacterium]|nr:30S ribosomal protein S5 [Clostridia bacterium]